MAEKKKRLQLIQGIDLMLKDPIFDFNKGVKRGQVQQYLSCLLMVPLSNLFRVQCSSALRQFRIIKVRRSNFNYYKHIDKVDKYKSIIERYNDLIIKQVV